jgi:selenocysteine-specific elongation factor
MIIATAGHIDHGKTALVRALTGVDTDRLAEERARGISIDVAFAHRLTADGPPLSFVDVPGHERFVKNMLAGVAAVDCALLVIAADDGPMPQTREHLEILDLLGIDALFVALTKIDRVEAGRVAEAAREIDELLAATRFRSARTFRVSARSGAGLDELLDALSDHAADRGVRDSNAMFRMAIDRAFSLAGIGPVVTGSVASGAVAVGDTLAVTPCGAAVRVRSLRVHGTETQRAAAGSRCAVALAGADPHRAEIGRGAWLVAPPLHRPTRSVVLRMRSCRGTPALRSGVSVHLYGGTADVPARLWLLDIDMLGPGAEGWALLRTARPMCAVRGDRMIVRDQAAQRTLGGGMVAEPFAGEDAMNRVQRVAAVEHLAGAEAAAAFAGLAATSPHGVDPQRFRAAWNLSQAAFQSAIAATPVRPAQWRGATRLVSAVVCEQMAAAVCVALNDHHVRVPHSVGPAVRELAAIVNARHAPLAFEVALQKLISDRKVVRHGAAMRLAGHVPQLAAGDAARWAGVRRRMAAGGLRPPRVRQLAAETGIELESLERLLRCAVDAGLTFRVAPNRFFLPQQLARLGVVAHRLASCNADRAFSASEFKDASGIGRNLAIRVLEYFDGAGLTRRVGDCRRLIARSEELFGDTAEFPETANGNPAA